MEQNRPATRRALSPKERRRRHRIRLVRNWTVFLLSCGAVMAVMTGGILWLLPRAYALIAPPTAFEAREYEGGAETDLSDKRLMLVNANLPLTEEPTPELAVADEATGVETLRNPRWYATMCANEGTVEDRCAIIRALHHLQ